MATDHTRLAERWGKFVKAYYALIDFRDSTAATVTIPPLGLLQQEFEDKFTTDEVDRFILTRLQEWVERARAAMNGIVNDLVANPFAAWVGADMRPQTSSPSTTVPEVLRDHAETMLVDSKRFLENTITVTTAPTAAAANRGDGKIVLSILEPIEKRSNERINTDEYAIVCQLDALQNGQTPGQETFLVSSKLLGGGPQVVVPQQEGYGVGYNRLTNGDMDDWSGTPVSLDSWAMVTGTYGTHVVKETSTVLRSAGASAKFVGDGVATTTEIKQIETSMASYTVSQRIKPQTHYLLSAIIKVSGGMGAGKTFEIEPKGSTFSAGATEKIVLTAPGVVDWTIYTAVWISPKDIPAATSMAVHVKQTGAPIAGTDIVYLEDVVLAEMVFWPESGTVWSAVRGPTKDFAALPRQDRFTAKVTNAYAGRFQTFCTRITDATTPDVRQHPDISRMMPSAAAAVTYTEALTT